MKSTSSPHEDQAAAIAELQRQQRLYREGRPPAASSEQAMANLDASRKVYKKLEHLPDGVRLSRLAEEDSRQAQEELSPELAAADRRLRKRTPLGGTFSTPHKRLRKRKPVEQKDRWFFVYAWMVRAYPRQIAAAVLGSDLSNKFLPSIRGEPPAARTAFKFGERKVRAWVCGNVYCIGERMGGWSRYRVLRAIKALNKPGSPLRINLDLGKAVYLQQAAWKLYCHVMEEEHQRVERERCYRADQSSRAKLEPSIESSPVMSSVMYREAQGTRLRRRDVVRCEGNLEAALVLAQIRAKVKYHHADEIFLRDEDLSSCTGLSAHGVRAARKFLLARGLIWASRKRHGFKGCTILFHYSLHSRLKS